MAQIELYTDARDGARQVPGRVYVLPKHLDEKSRGCSSPSSARC